jgi:hypothetical protein
MKHHTLSFLLSGTLFLSACVGSQPGVNSARLVMPGMTEALSHPAGGALTVRIGGFATEDRRLLAMASEVARVWVELSGTAQPPVSQWVERDDFVEGAASASFIGLAPGAFRVTARAVRADGKIVGSMTQIARVELGVTATISLNLQLNTEVVSSVSPPQTGNLTATATLSDGPVLSEPPVMTPIPLGEVFHHELYIDNWFTRFQIDKEGDVHVSFDVSGIGGGGMDSWNYLELLKRAYGSGYDRVRMNAAGPAHRYLDEQGYFYSAAGTQVYKNAFSGANIKSWTVPGPVSDHQRAIAAFKDGTVWASNGSSVTKLSPSGDILGSFDMGATTGALRVNESRHEVWVALPAASTVKRLSADGQVLDTIGVGHYGDTIGDLEMDSAGNLWVGSYMSGKLTEISPDGEIKRATYTARGIHVLAMDPFDQVWVLSGFESFSRGAVLTKVGADGKTLALFTDEGMVLGDYVTRSIYNMQCDPVGNVWIPIGNGSGGASEYNAFCVLPATR